MPYARNAELPKEIRDALPKVAQTIFRNVVNHALGSGGSEESAFRQAWGALKRAGWRRGETGQWVKKAQTVQTFIFDTEQSEADVNGGKGWTIDAARAWLRAHGEQSGNLRRPESGTQLRFQQFPRERCGGRFQTLSEDFPKGVSAVACAVAKEFSARFEVKKADEQGLVFGWASVAENDGVLVVDEEGDVIEPAELEKGAYSFVKDARIASDTHRPETLGIGVLVESMFFSKEKQELLGIDLPVGWWVGFQVDDPALRKSIRESQGHRAFSIGGVGTAEEL